MKSPLRATLASTLSFTAGLTLALHNLGFGGIQADNCVECNLGLGGAGALSSAQSPLAGASWENMAAILDAAQYTTFPSSLPSSFWGSSAGPALKNPWTPSPWASTQRWGFAYPPQSPSPWALPSLGMPGPGAQPSRVFGPAAQQQVAAPGRPSVPGGPPAPQTAAQSYIGQFPTVAQGAFASPGWAPPRAMGAGGVQAYDGTGEFSLGFQEPWGFKQQGSLMPEFRTSFYSPQTGLTNSPDAPWNRSLPPAQAQAFWSSIEQTARQPVKGLEVDVYPSTHPLQWGGYRPGALAAPTGGPPPS